MIKIKELLDYISFLFYLLPCLYYLFIYLWYTFILFGLQDSRLWCFSGRTYILHSLIQVVHVVLLEIMILILNSSEPLIIKQKDLENSVK